MNQAQTSPYSPVDTTVWVPYSGSRQSIFAELGFVFTDEAYDDENDRRIIRLTVPERWTIHRSHNDHPNTYDFFDPLGRRRVVTRHRLVDDVLALIAVPQLYVMRVTSAFFTQGQAVPMVQLNIRTNSRYRKGHPDTINSFGPQPLTPENERALYRQAYAWLDERYPDQYRHPFVWNQLPDDPLGH